MNAEFLYQTFIKIFVVLDPFGVLPMFVALTHNETESAKKRTALRASIIAGVILLFFAFVGDKLFICLEVSLAALNIAGGLLLLLAAIEMVVVKSHGFHATTAEENREAKGKEDVSVFPLAIPIIAGPGALTTVVMLMRQSPNLIAQGNVVIMISAVLAFTYILMRMASKFMKLLGITGTNVLTRVLGIILATLAVQIMLNGFIEVLRP